MVLNAPNEQLDRFIAAYKSAHGIRQGKYDTMFAAAKALSLKIPSRYHDDVNRHLIALFDRTGGSVAHWELMHSDLDKLKPEESVQYLAKLARDSHYSPREVIPYDEFIDLAQHAVHEVHFAKVRRR